MYIFDDYDFKQFLDIENGEEIKPILDFPDYYITNFGNVYSVKSGEIKQLAVNTDSRGLYLLVHLCKEKPHNVLIHRLVAKAFVPNPNDLPEVNHKDKNTQNPRFDNLEWCTRKENLYDSYSTMSSTRNYNTCELYKAGKLVDVFQSITEATKYAETKFGVSRTSLEKYLRVGDITLITEKTDRQTIADGKVHRTQNRRPITLCKNGVLIGTFKKYREVKEYIEKEEGVCSSETALNRYKKYKDYTLERDL